MTITFDMNSTTLSNPVVCSSMSKDVLETSSKLVDNFIQQDNSCYEMIDCLKMGGSSLPTVSGLNDLDYPGISELGISLQPLTQLTTVKRIALPPELVEQFGLMQSNCQMGLFPEVGRAWLTIDSRIFLWSFHDGSDLAYYDNLKQTILCVGLVKPKPGIFQNIIHYLLCLTTPTEIVILGANFSRQSSNSPLFEEMHLLPEPLFRFPCDNVYMFVFSGTDDGRIFFGGKDGAVYEFDYRGQGSWFSRKCWIINHSSNTLSFLVPYFVKLVFSEDDAVLQIAIDSSRHILYTRHEKGSIEVFDLGKDGKQMSKVKVLHPYSIIQQASQIARTINEQNFHPVVHISAVEADESKYVHLVAITQSGVRLYFTTNGSFGDDRPYTLALLHVRLPPGYTANTVCKPNNVHMAFYRKGFTLLSASQGEDDVLFATSNDTFAFFPQLIETHTTVMLEGHAWAIAEVPKVSSTPKPILTSGTEIACDPPDIVTQHTDPRREFVVINAQGNYIFSKPKPVDQLYKLLSDNKGPDTEAVKAFFMIHKEIQACAMCLILACSQNVQDRQIAEWAGRAFFLYGGEPHFNVTQISNIPIGSTESQLSYNKPSSPMSPVWASTPQNQQRMSNTLPQPQFSYVFSPVKPVPGTPPSPTPQSSISDMSNIVPQQLPSPALGSPTSDVVYSGKHNGLYLYFSRIVRPLWNTKIVSEGSSIIEDKKIPILITNFSSEELSSYRQQLLCLKQFLLDNAQSFHSSANLAKTARVYSKTAQGSIETSQYQKRTQMDADYLESVSLRNFEQLVQYTCEMLALWKILCEHQFHAVAALLSQDQQDFLKRFTFKDFIVDGKELSSGLTSALINFYLEDQACTGTVSQRLREDCPSIYRIEDATVSRAHEIVLNAKNIHNKTEKEAKLSEALKLCMSIAANVDLNLMCGLFRGVGFYKGIVELCLCSALRRDSQGLALHYYKNGQPQDDQIGMQAYITRMKCYKHAIDAINDLMSQSMSHPQSPSIPKVPGAPPSRDPNLLAPEEAKVYSQKILDMALKTDDQLFHVALYDWLIEKNRTNILLTIRSPYLEDYLKRCTTLRPDNSYVLDLLWKFYEMNQNFSAAARVLAKLADKHGIDMSLNQRIEYLSRAIMCARGSEMRLSGSDEGEFLHELEEKMEVARIQLRILEALNQRKVEKHAGLDATIDDAIASLDSNFMDIQTLYDNYALPYHLPEAQLALIQCGGLSEPALIEKLWENIIDKEIIASIDDPPDTRVKILQQKLKSICQSYKGSDKYFPLVFIIKYLEAKTCKLNFDCSWVFETILSLGIGIVDLVKIYHKLCRSKDSCWTTLGKPLHLFSVLALLIKHFSKSPSIVPLNERRSFTTYCLDIISGYLVDLQAMDSAIPNVPALIQAFKEVQRDLERLP